MPENWKTYTISDFIDINPKVPLKKGVEYSFVEMKDLDPNNKYVAPSVSKELKGGARFQNGDTLFARITPCLENGKICQVKDLENNLGFGSTEFLVFRGKEKISDSDFIFYLSRTPFFRKFSEGKMIGTSGRQRVAKDAFENLELSLPSLKEQKSIASILSALDDKIELNLQMNKTLEEMAMALYKHWFVDFGPFQDGEFVDSELGGIPKGWEIVELKKVCRVINGRAYKNEEFLNEGTPIIRIQNLKGAGKTVYSNLELPEDKYVDSGDLIYAWSATFGPYIWAGPKSIYHYHIWKLEVDSCKMSKFYMFHHLDRISAQLKEHGTGSIFTHLTKGSMEKQKMILPKQEIICDFHKNISPYHKLILRNKDQNQTITEIRDTLLPKLISGEVSVKDAEKTLSEVL